MSVRETNQRKKEYAKLLYAREGISSQRELAARVGVSEVTISKWIKKENWKTLKANLIITKQEQLNRFYEQVVELNAAIDGREPGSRYPNTKEADTLVKLSTAINNMETDTSVSDALNVLKGFIAFVRETDFEKAKMITEVSDAYVKSKLSR